MEKRGRSPGNSQISLIHCPVVCKLVVFQEISSTPQTAISSHIWRYVPTPFGSVSQLCLALWDPMDYSSLGSNVHGILQARILEWVAMPSSRGSSWPRDQSCLFPKISQIMSQISPLPSSRVIVCIFFFFLSSSPPPRRIHCMWLQTACVWRAWVFSLYVMHY